MKPLQRQRGIAVITALLIVAIIATIATTLSFGQQIWIRQVETVTELSQAEMLRQGALEYARLLLTQNARAPGTSDTDHFGKYWCLWDEANERCGERTLPVDDNSFVSFRIQDVEGRFNLNNLVDADGKQRPEYREMYIRLLNSLDVDIDRRRAEALADTLIDWIDYNTQVQPNGAEDLDYANLTPPYRAANRHLASVEELRLIIGYTQEIVDALRKHVVLYPPVAAETDMNVNTANAPVIAALAGISVADAIDFVEKRKTRKEPFANEAELRAALPSGSNPKRYNFRSNHFIVSVTAKVGRTIKTTECIMYNPTYGPGPEAKFEPYACGLPILQVDTLDEENDETERAPG
jgi:general secretion pathway protein K